jgi:hypothetical protein
MNDRQLQEMLSCTGRIRAARNYSWTFVNAKYEEVLSILVNSRKRNTQ